MLDVSSTLYSLKNTRQPGSRNSSGSSKTAFRTTISVRDDSAKLLLSDSSRRSSSEIFLLVLTSSLRSMSMQAFLMTTYIQVTTLDSPLNCSAFFHTVVSASCNASSAKFLLGESFLEIAASFGIPLIVWGENSAFEYGTDDEALTGFKLNSNWLKKSH